MREKEREKECVCVRERERERESMSKEREVTERLWRGHNTSITQSWQLHMILDHCIDWNIESHRLIYRNNVLIVVDCKNYAPYPEVCINLP